jgi:hypothetical protein
LNSDDDDEFMSYEQQRALNLGKRMSQRGVPRCPRAPGSRSAAGDAPGTRSRAVPDSLAQESKAAASQRAPADQPQGAKAPPPTRGQGKGQESPVAQATHPMQTRQRASGAGGLRGVDGSGQTQGCGHASPPSKPGS